jgi:hypothetical protein
MIAQSRIIISKKFKHYQLCLFVLPIAFEQIRISTTLPLFVNL